MEPLYKLLEIRPGLTAVIGGGGKTSLLYHLAGELKKQGSVILTTTTHICRPEHLPFADTEEALRALQKTYPVICIGTEGEDGKLTAPSFAGWEQMADYVLVEADGAKMHPLKAHAPHEPVLPACRNNTICVVGASGFGQPIIAAAHRAEVYARLTGRGETTVVTPEMAAQAVRAEGLHDRVFLNQTDVLTGMFARSRIKDFTRAAGCPVVAGSLRQGLFTRCNIQ